MKGYEDMTDLRNDFSIENYEERILPTTKGDCNKIFIKIACYVNPVVIFNYLLNAHPNYVLGRIQEIIKEKQLKDGDKDIEGAWRYE